MRFRRPHNNLLYGAQNLALDATCGEITPCVDCGARNAPVISASFGTGHLLGDSKKGELMSSQKERGGGPVVKDWGSHFLRDDTEIGRSAGCFGDQEEAYSLFCVEPYGRVIVLCGSKEWAVKQADKIIFQEMGNDHTATSN